MTCSPGALQLAEGEAGWGVRDKPESAEVGLEGLRRL